VVNVPPTANLGNTFARFRISSAGGLGSSGAAADGEVEDHLITVYQTTPTAINVDGIGVGSRPILPLLLVSLLLLVAITAVGRMRMTPIRSS
jgi:hypothetical protein